MPGKDWYSPPAKIKSSKYDEKWIKAKAKDMKDPDWQRKHRKELD